MSDAKILDFLSNHRGGLCVRLHRDQLDCELVSPVPKPWYRSVRFAYFFSVMMPGSILPAFPADPQPSLVQVAPESYFAHNKKTQVESPKNNFWSISGRVFSEYDHQALGSVSVKVLDMDLQVFSDENGSYEIQIPTELGKKAVLLFSRPGYQDKKAQVWRGAGNVEVNLVDPMNFLLGEVVIFRYKSIFRRGWHTIKSVFHRKKVKYL